MGILSNIFRKIFPSSHPAVQPAPQTTPGSMQSAGTATAGSTASAAPPPAAPMEQVDVEAILSGMPNSSNLNWRTSIVDLLKLLNLDSDLSSRKELAAELDFKGDTSDSASMNIWLHRQVMNKLAANGGKVPADLKD